MKQLKGTTGKIITINPAKFKHTKLLRECIARELMKHKIDIGNPKTLEQISKNIKENIGELINLLKDVLLGLETSQEFNNVIWLCLQECTYDNAMITEQLFDDIPEYREDYDLIVMEVVKENLRPFLKSLNGLLPTTKEET